MGSECVAAEGVWHPPYPATRIQNLSWIDNKCGVCDDGTVCAASGIGWTCSKEDACFNFTVVGNQFGNGASKPHGPPRPDAGQYNCHFIESFSVSGNSPGEANLVKCMANSMNRTEVALRIEV